MPNIPGGCHSVDLKRDGKFDSEMAPEVTHEAQPDVGTPRLGCLPLKG